MNVRSVITDLGRQRFDHAFLFNRYPGICRDTRSGPNGRYCRFSCMDDPRHIPSSHVAYYLSFQGVSTIISDVSGMVFSIITRKLRIDGTVRPSASVVRKCAQRGYCWKIHRSPSQSFSSTQAQIIRPVVDEHPIRAPIKTIRQRSPPVNPPNSGLCFIIIS